MDGSSPARPEKSPPLRAVAARARTAFRDRFGAEATLIAAAPGRVNLIGDHTDYNGGFVLPMAIDRYCIAAAAPGTRPGRWRVHAAELGQDAELDVRARLNPGDVARGLWISYIAGVAAGFQERSPEPLPALDIVIAGTVPVGAGLASSAAIEVATATLLECATGVTLERVEKARLCQYAEHDFAGVPCGLMDQLTSVMGRAGYALLIDCRAETIAPVRLPRRQDAVVLVIDSGVRHELAASEYAKRREACESAARKLGAHQLRDARASDIARQRDLERAAEPLTEEERRCVRHVLSENQRVIEAVEGLRAGDLPAVGRAMLRSHESLRDDYRVSCPELDAIVDALSDVPGVFGARMTGAGFGGCAIAVAVPGAWAPACSAVGGRAISCVTAVGGARMLA